MKKSAFGSMAAVAIAVLLAAAGTAAAQGGADAGRIVLIYAPGGVLTEDGTLWQFNLEKGVWVTVDEAFREQGQETEVLPLPVPVERIARMESFGFLVTREGVCWLYDLQRNQWREVGSPPRRN
ncbi:MAG: hypothetical protein GF346_06350 [Candidatus Eisenbacteria bacterium]|nr:hypothetical protein [Candidatus Latescibacterota bacterium]MBD3302047.1 hypothetical protein [Candidatus Eisenbacteria bacterium]